MTEQPKVIIRCLVYNHEPYLRDCLDGFVMQKTSFPFKAVVHDDCSTDGSAAIIREYAEKYPHIIEPIYETENQYSKRDGSLGRVMDAATLGRSPYIAYCEGDDYWIDPFKLQKQVDYMDTHPECSMTCTNAEVNMNGKYLQQEDFEHMQWGMLPSESGELSLENIINYGGGYIYTCSILVRENILKQIQILKKNFIVGDYPLQITAALFGQVYYFRAKTAVYNFAHPGSWNEHYASVKVDKYEKLVPIKIADMLGVLDSFSNYNHTALFSRKRARIVVGCIKDYPYLGHEIKRKQRDLLLYKRARKYEKIENKDFIQYIKWIIRRICFFPYYPYSIVLKGKFFQSIARCVLRKK